MSFIAIQKQHSVKTSPSHSCRNPKLSKHLHYLLFPVLRNSDNIDCWPKSIFFVFLVKYVTSFVLFLFLSQKEMIER